MFGIKTYIKKQLKEAFLSSSPCQFPKEPISLLSQELFLSSFSKQLKDFSENIGIGSLLTKPNKTAISAWRKFLPFVANNLGNWSTPDIDPYNIATKIEREVIWKIIDLYQASQENLEGYITSGGTEGNIFSAWLGRKYLEQYTDKERICLLRNDLTHYSIRKAADVVGVKDFIVPLEEKSWSTNVHGLSKLIIQLYRKGLRGFIIPITFGHTVGGTNDDLEGIINILNKVKSRYKDIYLFYWIDAALSGLVLPFKQKDFKPFIYSQIQTFVVDFHKFAGIPYPAGLILFRSHLRKLIEKDIPYLKQKDGTLLGSRSGIAAIAIWAMIHSYGFTGLKNEVDKCIMRKNKFLENLKKNFPPIEIKTETTSVAAALIVKEPLPSYVCKKYGIELINYKITLEDSNKIIKLYKLFFLPHF